MIEVKLTFSTAAEAAAALALLSGNASAAPSPAKATGGKGAAATPASTPKPSAEAEKPKALDYEKDFKPHIVAAGAKHGRDGIVGFLTETFGVAGGKDIKPEQLTAENLAKLVAFKEKEADVA